MAVTGISSESNLTYINPYLYENRVNRFYLSDKQSNSADKDKDSKSADDKINSIDGKKQSNSADKDKAKKIEKLKKRDAEVKQHEQAHLSAAGQYAKGGANFEYTTGPDGQRYASGGDVSIDMSKVPNDPQATIIKAQIIKRAALAPAEPSPQDRRVAAEATKMELEAQQELMQKKTQNTSGYNKEGLKTSSKQEPVFLNFYI